MRLLVAFILLALAGCGPRLAPADFSAGHPRFRPEEFFAGRVSSWGVVEDGAGNPTQRFTTRSLGRREGDDLVISQEIAFDGGEAKRRVWHLRRLDDVRYTATVDDIVGTATGEAQGNVLRLEYTLALAPGNPLKNVDVTHWMYLEEGGATMLNRIAFRKLGIVVAQATERFRRE